ncbi:ribosomal prt L30 [Nucleospora cyclopteri]
MSKRKTQKTGVAFQLPLAIKTGKFVAGFKQAIDSIIQQKSKYIVIANNMPEEMRRKIEYYAVLGKTIPIEYYSGNNNELSTLIGINHRSSVISILDQGEADFSELQA